MSSLSSNGDNKLAITVMDNDSPELFNGAASAVIQSSIILIDN